MNHIPFELALMRRDELLRLAAERRLVSRAAISAKATPRAMPALRRHRLRRRRKMRLAARG
jgi:hypothetical protein